MEGIKCITCPAADGERCRELYGEATSKLSGLVSNFVEALSVPPKSRKADPHTVSIRGGRAQSRIVSDLANELGNIGCTRSSHREVLSRLQDSLRPDKK